MSDDAHEGVAFLRGGGNAGARIAAFDWSTTPLGPLATWPSALRTTVGMMVHTAFPMALAWGTALTTLHNDAFEPILGGREALGRPFSAIWHDVWAEVGPIADRAMRGESTFIRDQPLDLLRDGRPERAYYTFSYSPVLDADGTILGMLDTVIETTHAVLAMEESVRTNVDLEAEIRRRTQERDLAWNFAQDLQLVLDARGALRAANRAWTHVSGWSMEESIGRRLQDFVVDDGSSDDLRRLMHLRAGDAPVVAKMRHRDGSHRWVSWLAKQDGDVLYASGRDVTLERNGVDQLALAHEQLRQAQKMEAFGQLTGGIAHDFNNLLQAVSGSIEMLGRKHVHSDGGHRLLVLADRALDRASHLTRQLLAFARKQSLDVRPIDLNAAMTTSIELAARSLPESIVVERDFLPNAWPAMSDPNQLDVAVLNLIINARDAMPTGGRITVSTANAIAPGDDVAPDLADGQYAVLSVTDTGTGMSDETRSRVFEPFFTTKDVGKGTGLGLSQVYGFAHQSGGSVRIVSTLGTGTRVDIFLPRARDNEAAADERVDAIAWRGRETVLVVDDDRDVRDLAVACLQEYGYRVLEAGAGVEALELIGEEASIDLLLIDFAMPQMNGAETVRLARRMRPELEVLFITGYADLRALHEHVGANAIVQKPFKLAQLADRVAKGLARRSLSTERLS